MNSKKILSLVLTCSFFLVGCQEQTALEQHPVAKDSISSQENAGNTQNKTLSLGDQAAYEGALQLKDEAFCDKISSEEMRGRCKDDLSNGRILEEAITKADRSLCEKMSNKEYQDACEIKVELAKKEKAMKEENEKNTKAMQDQYNKIIAEGNLEQCDTLTDNNFKLSCKSTVLTNKALKNKDKSLCEKIEQKELQEDCKRFVDGVL